VPAPTRVVEGGIGNGNLTPVPNEGSLPLELFETDIYSGTT
jgi:hypothetical protein